VSLVGNERTKLLAGALDRLSTACLTIGVVTPAAGLIYGFVGRFVASGWFLVVAGAMWSGSAVALHLVARWVLGGLKE
jgi:hypothetical protein